jgi:hypothetical protein
MDSESIVRKYWHCKGCQAEAVTFDDSTPMHYCNGMRRLLIPLIGVDLPAKITVVGREDYIGNEIQRSNNGKPVQCVLVESEDGVDAYAYAPVATADGDTT